MVGRQKSEPFERPFVAVKRSHEQARKYSNSTVSFSLELYQDLQVYFNHLIFNTVCKTALELTASINNLWEMYIIFCGRVTNE